MIDADFFDGLDHEIVALTSNKTKTFSFTIEQSSRFLDAIQCLHGMDFDANSIAQVSVGHHGFEINVRNSETGLSGYLHLPKSSLIEFNCIKPFHKTLFLNQISDSFGHSGASKDDNITFFHVVGQEEICIEFGGSVGYAISIYEIPDVAFERYLYPDFRSVGQSTFSSEGLRNFILVLAASEEPKQVITLEITGQGPVISIPNGFAYKEEKEKVVTQFNMDGLVGIRASFTFPHRGSIAHASRFAYQVCVSVPLAKYPTESPNSIVFQFKGDDMVIGYILKPVPVFLFFRHQPRST